MPTERFYHLPEGKKQMIREAAIKEFSRVPMEKVSINKIVKSAEISRGSFYTYFKDKEDVLQYIFEDFVVQIQEFCQETLKRENGRFWELPGRLLEYILEVCDRNKMITLAQKAIGHQAVMQMLEDKAGICWEIEETKDEWLKEMYRITDCSELRVESCEDFQILFSICISILVATVGEIYRTGFAPAVARQLFEKRMKVIRYGASRQPDSHEPAEA